MTQGTRGSRTGAALTSCSPLKLLGVRQWRCSASKMRQPHSRYLLRADDQDSVTQSKFMGAGTSVTGQGEAAHRSPVTRNR